MIAFGGASIAAKQSQQHRTQHKSIAVRETCAFDGGGSNAHASQFLMLRKFCSCRESVEHRLGSGKTVIERPW